MNRSLRASLQTKNTKRNDTARHSRQPNKERQIGDFEPRIKPENADKTEEKFTNYIGLHL
jgi:hypothetical protein